VLGKLVEMALQRLVHSFVSGTLSLQPRRRPERRDQPRQTFTMNQPRSGLDRVKPEIMAAGEEQWNAADPFEPSLRYELRDYHILGDDRARPSRVSELHRHSRALARRTLRPDIERVPVGIRVEVDEHRPDFMGRVAQQPVGLNAPHRRMVNRSTQGLQGLAFSSRIERFAGNGRIDQLGKARIRAGRHAELALLAFARLEQAVDAPVATLVAGKTA
jgi:hypothetical protein